jgi:hypothetical protein
MSAAATPITATADARPPGRPVFRQVFNRYSVTAVFYLALLFVVSRIAFVVHVEPLGEWGYNALRYLRQTLISGLLVLLAIALAESLLEQARLTPGWQLLVRGTGVAAGAVAGALTRLLVANGNLDGLQWSWFVPTVGVWLLNGGLGYALLRYARHEAAARRRLTEAARQREVLAAQGVEARLSALQAQIEPHFLFNTLAHVQRLYETEPGRGREMLRSLIDYLRAALPSMRRSGSSLRRELELARSFLTILQLRMGERLVFEITADTALLDLPVPPMVLPTLVENAIKHGLAPLPQGGRIDISAHRIADGRLAIEVADTGMGFVAEGGSGVGLANTRSRLAALYGDRAALSLRCGPNGGVVAQVLIPVPTGGAAAAQPVPMAEAAAA